MSKITCKLFGVPQITKDGQSVFLPYAKINALLYYLMVTKVASRDEIAGLLWPDENGTVARKNIRNAIYQAKKSLGEDIILSPQKSFLILNEDLEIECDVDMFLKAPRENLNLYTGDFLQGFFLKEAESFEYWVTKMRSFYEEKFSTECYLKIEEDIQNKNYEGVENRIHRLIELDEFDERNFRLLMRFYGDTGRNGKVVETYYDLARFLRRELGIDPDRKTKEIYERALEQINFDGEKKHNSQESFFYGRYNELAAMEKALKNFQQKREGKGLLIKGEGGVGKSTLKKKLLESADNDDFFILKSSCYQVEQNWHLRPWGVIAKQIGALVQENELILPELWSKMMCALFPDFDQNLPDESYMAPSEKVSMASIVQVFGEALNRLSERKQIILSLEDIQWMDADSVDLLTALLLELDPLRVMLIATCSMERNLALNNMISTLNRYDRLVTVSLERFSIEACYHFIEEALPNEKLKGETLERIYNETEGNPFFLSEFIGVLKAGESLDELTPAMLEAIKNRFLYLTAEELELASLLCYFYGKVSFNFLIQLLDKDPHEVLPLLESLKNHHIIKEIEEDHTISLAFTHCKLREYLYMIQPASRKRLVHQKIGQQLESMLGSGKKDSKLNAKLIYHFSAAGDYLRVLKYQIGSLSRYLNFSHEMFPILDTSELEQEANVYMSRNQIGELFNNLESSFKDLQSSAKDRTELDSLEVEFFYMKGRYLIREGNYDDGVDCIEYVIEKGKQIEDRDHVLEGYKQMILYHLQVYNLHEMSEYIELALDLAVKCNYHKEIGIILRLKGLYNIMVGNYFIAEKLLTESINTLAVTEKMAKRYATNISAAYNYIGEIRQAEEDYSGALELFHKAISLCLGPNVSSSLSYFYINAGKTSYIMGDNATAMEYFEKAYSLYGEFDSFWRRSVLDSYTALALVKEGRYQEAERHILSAQKNVGHIKDPSELGTVYFAEALIRRTADQDPDARAAFGDELDESAEDFCRQALKNLSEYCNRYEIKTLHQIFD